MPLINTPKLQIFFAHIPKAGGSSVEDYLIRRFGSATMIDKYKRSKTRGTGLINSCTHLSSRDLEEFIPKDLGYCFTVVRDPVARMISEYKFQTGHSRTTKVSFSTWLKVMLHCVNLESRIYDNHIRPQSDLVPEGAEVFQLEDGFDKLVNRLDIITESTAPEVDFGHLLKRTPKKEIVPSRQDVDLIYQFYDVDYERFSYSKQDTSQLPNDTFSFFRNLCAMALAWPVVLKQRYNWLK